jgi:hypothetical protein
MVGGAIGLAVFGTIAWTVVANSVRAGAVHATTAADRAGHAARPSLAGLTAIYHYALAAGFSRALLAAVAAMLLALAITVVTIQIDNHSPQRMNHETHDHRGHLRNRTGTASAGRRSGTRRHRPPTCSASSRSAPSPREAALARRNTTRVTGSSCGTCSSTWQVPCSARSMPTSRRWKTSSPTAAWTGPSSGRHSSPARSGPG